MGREGKWEGGLRDYRTRAPEDSARHRGMEEQIFGRNQQDRAGVFGYYFGRFTEGETEVCSSSPQS
jgi:hypothetical protein